MRAGLLLLDEFGAVLGGVDVRPPLLGVCLGLDLELVGHPLALQLPIVFVDGRVDDLLLFVDCSHPNVLLIIDVVLFSHIRLVDQEAFDRGAGQALVPEGDGQGEAALDQVDAVFQREVGGGTVGEAILDVAGGNRSRVSFSMIHQTVPALDLIKAQYKESVFSVLSIQHLPIEEQGFPLEKCLWARNSIATNIK